MLTFRMPLGYVGRPLISWNDIGNRMDLAYHFARLLLESNVEFTEKEYADIKIIQTWYEETKENRRQKTFYFASIE